MDKTFCEKNNYSIFGECIIAEHKMKYVWKVEMLICQKLQ
ncbi:hypothetical protein CTDIVETGP_1758 [Clostridium tyrobutyricum DIVETGP]|uniref:Uncharacterized protein n=1 Tax=Clostridium tyrobutyricum DIVETGP TaxID=1408889 RepID=W6N515_CLOTY|nr:hypothetical protein CTDIVETGP_1758 [Clostridium tyrobutyricum DIVETGP]